MHFVAYLQTDCITQGADRQSWVFSGSDYINCSAKCILQFRLHKLFSKVYSAVQTTQTVQQSVLCGSDYINFSAKCVLWSRLHKLFSKVCSVVQTTWTFRQSVFCGSNYINFRQSVFCGPDYINFSAKCVLWSRLHERFGKVCSAVQTTWTRFGKVDFCGSDFMNVSAKLTSAVQTTWTFSSAAYMRQSNLHCSCAMSRTKLVPQPVTSRPFQ